MYASGEEDEGREGKEREGALRPKLRSSAIGRGRRGARRARAWWGGRPSSIGVEEREGHGLGEGGELGLEGQEGRSVGVHEGEGHACNALWGPAPHPRAAGTSSHGHGETSRIWSSVLYRTEIEKRGLNFNPPFVAFQRTQKNERKRAFLFDRRFDRRSNQRGVW